MFLSGLYILPCMVPHPSLTPYLYKKGTPYWSPHLPRAGPGNSEPTYEKVFSSELESALIPEKQGGMWEGLKGPTVVAAQFSLQAVPIFPTHGGLRLCTAALPHLQSSVERAHDPKNPQVSYLADSGPPTVPSAGIRCEVQHVGRGL